MMNFHRITLLLAVAGPAAEIVEGGTDRDTYRVGDQATVRIAIKNTGADIIGTVEARAAIEKQFLGSFIKLISDRLQVPIYGIKPGDIGRYEQTYTIPNFPGKYRVTVTVIADGQEIGSVRKIIEVTR